MKELFRTILMILLIMLLATTLYAESTVLKFSDPTKPGLIKTVSGNGNIMIIGYSGSEVIIETNTGEEEVETTPVNEKAKGLTRISGSSVSVTHDKENNAIEITRSMKHNADLTIKVPFTTSFKTGKNGNMGSDTIGNIQNMVMNQVFTSLGGGILTGNIEISNIAGDIEVSTMNGNIKLTGISGAVLANTMSGNIEVVFEKQKNDKPMSFSAMSGDIDITLLSSLKADLKIKNLDGEVFTDFDIEMIPVSTEEQSTSSNMYTGFNIGAMLGNNIYGKINNGGPEIRVTTLDGDIYVRKAQ